MRSYSHQPEPSNQDPTRQETTVLSPVQILHAWDHINQAIQNAQNKKKWTPEESQTQPAYIPGLPLDIKTHNTHELSPNQCAIALQIGLTCTGPTPEKGPLPLLDKDKWNLKGQEQLYILLPKYLLTHTIIILTAAFQSISDTEEKVKHNPAAIDAIQESKLEIIELTRVIETICKLLSQKGAHLVELIGKEQKLEQESHSSTTEIQRKQLKDLRRETQQVLGLLGKTVINDSYFALLAILHPYLKQVAKYGEPYEHETKEILKNTITIIQNSHQPPLKNEINSIKKATTLAIAIILTTFASAYITATQCGPNPPSKKDHSFINK